jgi:hypothetical protein
MRPAERERHRRHRGRHRRRRKPPHRARARLRDGPRAEPVHVSRKFNAGIQAALDQRHNPYPADYVVPCGSDDWIDHRLLLKLPGRHSIMCFQRMSFVREDGREMTAKFLNYQGGCGIRVYPREVMGRLGYRPADEDRARGCDTSILTNLSMEYERQHTRQLKIVHADCDPRQIVDWKSTSVQLNRYHDLRRHKTVGPPTDPFEALADIFPAEALEEMAAHYGRTRVWWRREGVRRLPGDRQTRIPRPRPRHRVRGVHRPAPEQRAIDRGDIRLLRRVTPDLTPGSFVLRTTGRQTAEARQTEAPTGASLISKGG